MSTLGQLSGTIDRNLKRVGELTKALIAIRAEILDKTDELKLTPEDVAGAKKIIPEWVKTL